MNSVEMHFVYGFLWNVGGRLISRAEWLALRKSLPSGWVSPPLHERTLPAFGAEPGDDDVLATYLPTFVLDLHCLEYSTPIRECAILPFSRDADPRRGLQQTKAVFTTRLFESGVGSITASFSVPNLNSTPDAIQTAHEFLRLVANVDLYPEGHPRRSSKAPAPSLESRLLWNGEPRWLIDRVIEERLQALELIVVPTGPVTCNDSAFLTSDGSGAPDRREFQAAYPLTLLRVEPEWFDRFQAGEHASTKAVASIAARMTVVNGAVLDELLHLSDEYIERCLNRGVARAGLYNWSHDRKLFYTFTRRAAVAVYSSPRVELRAQFVLPSYLNLLEILRSRLVGSMVVSAALGSLARLHAFMPGGSLDPFPFDQLEALRAYVIAAEEDVSEYLFDGGALTELGDEAEKSLLVRRGWHKAKELLRLVEASAQAWEAERLNRELLRLS